MGGFLCWRVGRSEVMAFEISDLEVISGMGLYLDKLQSLPDEIAKKEALYALIRTGVLDKDGKAKSCIVSLV